jgi:hypothetical protein
MAAGILRQGLDRQGDNGFTTLEELEGQHITLVRESTADTSAAQMGGKDPWLESQHATGSGGFLSIRRHQVKSWPLRSVSEPAPGEAAIPS